MKLKQSFPAQCSALLDPLFLRGRRYFSGEDRSKPYYWRQRHPIIACICNVIEANMGGDAGHASLTRVQ